MQVFKQNGLERYRPLKQKFDPNLHSALFEIPDPLQKPGTVAVVTKVSCCQALLQLAGTHRCRVLRAEGCAGWLQAPRPGAQTCRGRRSQGCRRRVGAWRALRLGLWGALQGAARMHLIACTQLQTGCWRLRDTVEQGQAVLDALQWRWLCSRLAGCDV